MSRIMWASALVLALMLVPGVLGIEMSITNNVGSTRECFESGLSDSVSMSTVLSTDSLKNKITGKGDFKEEHYSLLRDVGVGVDIKNAEWYQYDYCIYDTLIQVPFIYSSASEQIKVKNADDVKAFAATWFEKSSIHASKVKNLDYHNKATSFTFIGYTNQTIVNFKGGSIEKNP